MSETNPKAARILPEMKESLASSIHEILEIMFLAAVGDRIVWGPEPPALNARVIFRGNPSGEFHLAVGEKRATQLASGFLGLERTLVTKSQTGEVICELANMICGSALTRMVNDAIFEILPPELRSTAPEKEEPAVAYGVAEGSLAVWMRFDRAH
jgi:hypothetical protein